MKHLAYGARPLFALARNDDERLDYVLRGIFNSAAGSIAHRLHPEAFKEGELTLTADDDRWMQVAKEQRERLRYKLNEIIGWEVVRRISIRRANRPISSSSSTPPPTKESVKLPAETLEAAKTISHLEVRKAFLSLVASIVGIRAKRAR